MLESINIKKIATYDEAGIQITDLKKVNFFYGANGSGKTTITKLIGTPLTHFTPTAPLVGEAEHLSKR
ncbi:MAG: AAA family ATPase [Sediminibacterium sp.]|nr:AAA family ATPase [Sediminibacterium sp.]